MEKETEVGNAKILKKLFAEGSFTRVDFFAIACFLGDKILPAHGDAMRAEIATRQAIALDAALKKAGK